MKYFLFLDDTRQIGRDINFEVIDKESLPVICAKNYDEFVRVVEENGLPEVLSLDIDLHPLHYVSQGRGNYLYFLNDDSLPKCGYHCAIYLYEFCKKHKLKFPKYYIHSANTVGAQKLRQIIENLVNDNRQS